MGGKWGFLFIIDKVRNNKSGSGVQIMGKEGPTAPTTDMELVRMACIGKHPDCGFRQHSQRYELRVVLCRSLGRALV